jgi:predicted negative regulator of RcsB-dependent stress response
LAQHITRKELKKDEIRDSLVHGAEAVASHQQQIWIYGGAALFVVLAVLGWRYYTQNQASKASIAVAEAMKVYDARIRAVNEPADPGELTYVDEKNKDADAAKKFNEVADQFPRTSAGRMARYYAGISLEQAERYDEAEKTLKTVESGSDEGLTALARFQLAQIYDKTGRGPQAVQLYQQLEAKPDLFVPKAVVLLALGDHYSTADPAQAAKLYNQVKTEFPDTQAAQEADERLQLLPAKG